MCIRDSHTTGASNDIKQASNLARRMVTEFGMSDVIGPIHYGSDEESPFLGKEFGSSRSHSYSEKVANEIDEEVRRLIMEGHATATNLLSEHKDVLNRIAQALLDRETIDGEEVDAIVNGRDLPDRERVRIPTYAERERAAKEKRRAGSIFGVPPRPDDQSRPQP